VEEPEITIVSEKGQVVIPKAIRERMKIAPKMKLLVYCFGDTLIMKKLEIPDVEKKLEALYRRIDRKIAKYGDLSEEEIDEEIQRYRKEKRGR
jgi:AbrB family looped-hinge helix DNA binding protein